jgi:uncharacterized protein (TIGR02246 family)
MRFLIVITLGWLATQPAFAQGARDTTADETAVRDVVRKYVDAREKRDPRLLAALFTADADQLTTAGEWRKGRDNVVQGGLASSQANPGSRQIAIEVVRFVAAGVAIADGRYEIAGAAGAAPRRMRTTFVTIRDAGGVWRIAAIRNMAPTDPK